MMLLIGFNFITGVMVGFELVDEEEAYHLVVDLFIVRLLFTIERK